MVIFHSYVKLPEGNNLTGGKKRAIENILLCVENWSASPLSKAALARSWQHEHRVSPRLKSLVGACNLSEKL